MSDTWFISLTNSQKSLVDYEDFLILKNYKWQAQPTRLKDGFYAVRNNGYNEQGTRLKVKMHRQVMNCPSGYEVDHINGNTLDNRKSNLRIIEHSANIKNQKSRGGKSKYRGVTKHGHYGWRARLMVNYKRICLGVYDTQETAFEALQVAYRKYYGRDLVYVR